VQRRRDECELPSLSRVAIRLLYLSLGLCAMSEVPAGQQIPHATVLPSARPELASQPTGKFMKFEIIGEFRALETIATGRQIRALAALRKKWGPGKWRKMKGIALVRLRSGRVREAEIHWYEAHGIGRRDFKIKKLLK